MTPELYIPPCCIHNQLPSLIRTSNGAGVFYSQGDWGLPKLAFSVACMVTGDAPITLWLVLNEIDVNTLRLIKRYFSMGWTDKCILVTASDQRDLIHARMNDGDIKRLTYVPSRQEASYANLFAMQSQQSSLAVVGTITCHDDGPKHLCQYAFDFAERKEDDLVWPTDSFRRIVAPWRSMSRLHAAAIDD